MFDSFVIYARRITLSLITLRIKQREQFHLAQPPRLLSESTCVMLRQMLGSIFLGKYKLIEFS